MFKRKLSIWSGVEEEVEKVFSRLERKITDITHTC